MAAQIINPRVIAQIDDNNIASSGGTTNELCVQATFQIEAMCFALRNAAVASDTDALPYLVQGVAQRIIDLNAALMNLFNGEEDALADLRHTVFGNTVEVSHV